MGGRGGWDLHLMTSSIHKRENIMHRYMQSTVSISCVDVSHGSRKPMCWQIAVFYALADRLPLC